MSLAAIPSPPSPTLTVGPLMIHYYALFVVLGVAVAAVITARRWAARGGQPGIVGDVLLVAVPVGLVGARLYHVATSWQLFFGAGAQPWRAVAVWEGGLAIHGGLIGGLLSGGLYVWSRGLPLLTYLDIVAPYLPLGQAIGRWGNFFNEEAFGGPTQLPWKLYISEARRPPQFLDAEYFHPTFLYESIWNLGIFLILGFVLRRRLERAPGALFLAYLGLYALGRFWVEGLRTDSLMLGQLRVAQVVSVLSVLLAIIGIPLLARRRRA